MAVVSLSLDRSASSIPETEVSVQRLEALLNGALFEVELDDDGDIYVRDGLEFPVWIRVLAEDKMLKVFTYATSENGKTEPTLEVANLMNRTIKLPQFHLDGKFVSGAFRTRHKTIRQATATFRWSVPSGHAPARKR